MALPICEKTWAFSVNNVCGSFISGATDAKTFLLTLKDRLVSLGWVVVASSDGVTSGFDGVDRWTNIAKIPLSSGGAKGWMVLGNSALATNCQFLIGGDDPVGNLSSVSFDVSVTGFGVANGGTNGSTTAIPTSAAAGLISQLDTRVQGDIGFSNTLHVAVSADRECTRILWTNSAVYSINTYAGFILIDKVKNPVSEWTVPVVCLSQGIGAATAMTPLVWSNTGRFASKIGGTALDLRATCEASNNISTPLTTYLIATDDASSDWPMLPMSLCCITAGHRNWRKGQIYDLWWGSNNVASGDTYPASGSTRQFVQIQQLILPWNGLVTPGGTAINLS